jgi:hypothetical protein
MSETINNITNILIVAAVLFLGVFVLRFVLRLAWKFVRAALVILSLILIAGYFFGLFDIVIH